ncbi:hypothetical protein GT204_34560 [Streptomyces sp. SID4919]|nr:MULTISPECIES: hypothetical protein [unclassified Streptomyces]MYY13851.1 hypothetical protein [Streptomyces sp. SID4919]
MACRSVDGAAAFGAKPTTPARFAPHSLAYRSGQQDPIARSLTVIVPL